MKSYLIKSAPAVEPLTLNEVKAHVRVLDLDFDTELTALIKTAREYCENYLNQSLITQEWYLSSEWPKNNVIEIGKTPIQSIDAVQYLNSDNTSADFAESDYNYDIGGEPIRIKFKEKPDMADIYKPILITFTAGYGANGAAVPSVIKHAMLLFIAHLFENRGDDGIKTPPRAFYELLNQKRVRIF